MADKKYTKADIIDSLYEKTGLSRKEIRVIVELFIDEIKNALVRGMAIELRGFGTFIVKVRKGRSKARNPKTGEPIEIRPHGIASFRAGQELKQDVWNLAGGGPE
ncbi:MAG: integration host factor subunit beta [Treponema sp.]|jgi:integration host factor subunit beta|nr:integration host factor subunit beta [Treponema sp.]